MNRTRSALLLIGALVAAPLVVSPARAATPAIPPNAGLVTVKVDQIADPRVTVKAGVITVGGTRVVLTGAEQSNAAAASYSSAATVALPAGAATVVSPITAYKATPVITVFSEGCTGTDATTGTITVVPGVATTCRLTLWPSRGTVSVGPGTTKKTILVTDRLVGRSTDNSTPAEKDATAAARLALCKDTFVVGLAVTTSLVQSAPVTSSCNPASPPTEITTAATYTYAPSGSAPLYLKLTKSVPGYVETYSDGCSFTDLGGRIGWAAQLDPAFVGTCTITHTQLSEEGAPPTSGNESPGTETPVPGTPIPGTPEPSTPAAKPHRVDVASTATTYRTWIKHHRLTFRSVVTDSVTLKPVAGVRVVVTVVNKAGKRVTCAAVTRANGRATCTSTSKRLGKLNLPRKYKVATTATTAHYAGKGAGTIRRR